MEGSIWKCHFPLRNGEECQETVEQVAMEDHLHRDHRINPRTPDEVLGYFTLVRGNLHRGHEPRLRRANETMQMFDFVERHGND